MPDPKPVQPGDRITTQPLNSLIEEVRWLKQVRQGPGISIHKSSGGWTISATDEGSRNFLGIVQAKGPNDEDDYKDNRYWVQYATCSNTTATWSGGSPTADSNYSPTDALTLATQAATLGSGTNPYYRVVTCTNIAEPDKSHLLQAGDYVWVQVAYDKGQTSSGIPNYRYYCYQTREQVVKVTISSHTPSGIVGSGQNGMYTGSYERIWEQDVNPTTGVAGHTDSTTVTCIIDNWLETSTNYVPSGTTTLGLIVGLSNDSPPKPLVAVFLDPSPTMVPCTVVDDGSGAQPGMTGPTDQYATFKYNCFDISGGGQIGTSLSPLKPRLPGYCVQQSNAPHNYAVGFWSGSTFNLWDAGETISLWNCPNDGTGTSP